MQEALAGARAGCMHSYSVRLAVEDGGLPSAQL